MSEHGPELDLASLTALLDLLIDVGGFRLKYQVEQREGAPRVAVQFTGQDTGLLLARHAEVLHAFEHLAAKALRLEPEQHELIRFDAEGYKEARDEGLQLAAVAAVDRVKATGQAHRFPPMTSRERRMLHLAFAGMSLVDVGLEAASEGEGPGRHMVLRPARSLPSTSC